jgi:hypothetical protein
MTSVTVCVTKPSLTIAAERGEFLNALKFKDIFDQVSAGSICPKPSRALAL